MKSIAILLTDNESINEQLIIKSYKKLNSSRIKKIFLIGDKNLFPKIYKLSQNTGKKINFVDILYKKKPINYLKDITYYAVDLFNKKKISYLINMPINKKKFLNNKYPGYTEFFSHIINSKKKTNMLLFNEKFSVCPLTTHILLKNVEKKLDKIMLKNSIENIYKFYKDKIKKKISIVVLGLNPHAGKDLKNSKDNTLINSVIKSFNNKINISGPVSPDTAFSNLNNKIFIGMYHDQVLIPFKMVNKFNGVNITIGNELIRMSPDHGTAEDIKNKKKLINNQSFLSCIKFCEKY